MNWKRLDRKTIYDTEYLKVFEDKIELPNGFVYENYGIVQFPYVVFIVATTRDGQILTLNEYKYGSDEVMRTFPAGHLKKGESSLIAAKRELLEETGYTSKEFEFIGRINEFPTKNIGIVDIVRAKNVYYQQAQELDENEFLKVVFITKEELGKEIQNGLWHHAGALAAITLTEIINP